MLTCQAPLEDNDENVDPDAPTRAAVMLRAVCLSILVFWAFSNSSAPAGTPSLLTSNAQAQDARIVLPDGTPIQLRITHKLSAATAKVGDRVEFEVVQDIRVGDFIVIPHRAIAWGSVSKVQPSRRVSRSGILALEIKAATAVTEEQVPLRGVRTVQGNLPNQEAAERVGWIIPVLVMKGNEAFISKGGKVDAYLNGDASFDPTLLRQSMTTWEMKNAALLAAATGGKVEVHIYRHVPDVTGGKPQIYLDAIELAHMQSDRYFNVFLDPGKHTFRTTESEISIDCKIGQEYYLRVERQGSFSPKAHLSLVSNLQGEDEIYSLEPSSSKDIVDRSKLAIPRADQ